MNRYYHDSRQGGFTWKKVLPKYRKLKYMVNEKRLQKPAFSMTLKVKFDYIKEAFYLFKTEE